MKRKILLIGWDAADWKVINPLMDAGYMPTLNKLVEGGVVGNIATLDPPLSPMLWTSIATGKTADKHGITSFAEPIPNEGGIRPVNVTSRKTRALWNILSNQGYKCNVVGWWPSHPAEPINGAMVSNFYQQAGKPYGEPWKMLKGTIYPSKYARDLAWLRVHPGEITAAHLLPFVPLMEKVDQDKDLGLVAIAKILSHASSIHAASTWLMENSEWDFMAVYYDSIDHFGHSFMKYHPPRRPHIPEERYELYKDVVASGYRFHDMMLERLLKLAGDDVTVMIVSDHGFHSDHLRPAYLPELPAAPAYEHSPYGIICINGRGIREDERVFGASLLDVTPTILNMYGLPVGRDMDGKVLMDAFTDPAEPRFIESWDKEPGDFYEHPPHMQEDALASAEALKQLIELGYIEDPGEDKKTAMEKTVNESRYNLSRVLLSKKKYSEALLILEALFEYNSKDIRYGIDLAKCYINLDRNKDAIAVVKQCRETEYGKQPVLDFLEGVVLVNEGEAAAALEIFRKVESLDDCMPELHVHLGKVYLQMHDYGRGGAAFSRALELDENNAAAFLGLGISLLRRERYLEAIDQLLNAVGLIYNYPIAHYHIGETLYHLGKYRESAEAFEVTLVMRPNLIKARRFLVKIYSEHVLNAGRLNMHREFLRHRMKGDVVVVSGLPRSGTSLMMQVLKAGGMEILSDGERVSDVNNPKGYFELQAVKKSASDVSWIEGASDKAVKVIAHLLQFLPNNYELKVIFMQRDIREIMLSQQKMLGKQPVYNVAIAQAFEKELEKVKAWAQRQPNVEILYVPYADLVNDPGRFVYQIADFVGYPLDTASMKLAIDPSLYRNKL
jgi:predicted AlkP superfamily phosphohydrolase/phosphomutase/tetratricopeptide (TPR) repeat protein